MQAFTIPCPMNMPNKTPCMFTVMYGTDQQKGVIYQLKQHCLEVHSKVANILALLDYAAAHLRKHRADLEIRQLRQSFNRQPSDTLDSEPEESGP